MRASKEMCPVEFNGECFPLGKKKKSFSFVKTHVSVAPDGARALIGINTDLPGEKLQR